MIFYYIINVFTVTKLSANKNINNASVCCNVFMLIEKFSKTVLYFTNDNDNA